MRGRRWTLWRAGARCFPSPARRGSGPGWRRRGPRRCDGRARVSLPLLPSQGLLHLYAPNAAKCIGQLRRSVLGHAVKTANEAAPLRAPTSESSSNHTAPSRSYRATRCTSKDDSRAASTRRESQLVGEKRLASRGPGFKNLSETNHARPQADARAPSAPSWRELFALGIHR